MKWWIIVLCVVLLTGCSAKPVWETVDDVLPADGQVFHQYEILLDIPQSLTYLGGSGKDCLYQSGAVEVQTTSFYAADLDAAVRQLSGFSADHLNIVKTLRENLPEYQFAWYSETEEGGRVYRADLVMDDAVCYAVVCSASETAEGFHEQARQVFSAFTLSDPEKI